MKKFIALGANKKKLKEGIEPISLNMADSMQTMCDKTFNKDDIVIGHSMGASIALMIAAKTPPKELHLYSPALIFKETISLLGEEDLKYFGEKINEIKPIPKITCPVTIYVGELEDPIMLEGAVILVDKLDANEKVVPDANHMTVVNDFVDNWG